ncbi:MAG TPA: protein phosphatase 2C domain-containing protein [Microlunatus sp.]|nr:protein phosphatase 2C domain-containing protein [Microlunatus sp.]
MASWTVRYASEPGNPARANEDYFTERNGVAVLLDGAGSLVDLDSGCIHGVQWFVQTLADDLVDVAGDRGRALTDALGEAIERTAAAHRVTCDLSNPNSPTSTVVVVRLAGSAVEYLVLADSTLIYGKPQPWTVVTDTRIELVGHAGISIQARAQHMERLAHVRNHTGGFWVAGPQPEAAAHSYTGAVPVDQVHQIALLSDGAARLVDKFQLADWETVMRRLSAGGPGWLLSQIRNAEDADPYAIRWPRSKLHDDATVAIIDL